jgi:ribosomal protein L32
VVTVVLMIPPGPVQGVPGLVDPIGLTRLPGFTPLAGLLIAVVAVGETAAATATLIVRLVRARRDQRTRLALIARRSWFRVRSSSLVICPSCGTTSRRPRR